MVFKSSWGPREGVIRLMKRESAVLMLPKNGVTVFSHRRKSSRRHEMKGGFVVDGQGLV